MPTTEARTARAAGDASGGLVYDGFISYSHAADDLLAPRLQAGLQRFAKPWWKRRAVHIFRDEASLSANPHLWSSITDALDGSGWFVLLLSPEAAESEWVDREVGYWQERKDAERIIPVLTDGDFAWHEGRIVSGSAPPALRGAFSDEPRWVDLRFARTEEQLDLNNPRFSAAVADIASAIRGVPKEELESEEVRQHRRTTRTAWAAALALIALVVIAGAAAVYAFGQQNRANDLAEQEAAARQDAETQQGVAEAAASREGEARALADENAAEATRQAQVARSRELTASAVSVLEENPELSMLLALESIEATPPNEAVSPAGALALRDAASAFRLLARFPVTAGAHNAAAISADGTTIFHSSGQDRAVTAFDVATGAALWRYHDPTTVDAFDHLSLSPDETLVAVTIIDVPLVVDPLVAVDADGNDEHSARVVVLDAEDGEVVTLLSPGQCEQSTTRLGGFSPDGMWLAIGTGTEACGVDPDDPDADWIAVYDTETWNEEHRLRLGDGLGRFPGFPRLQVAFAPDSRRIVLSGAALPNFANTEIRSFPDQELLNELPPSLRAVFSPDGERILLNAVALAEVDFLPRVVDAGTGELVAHLNEADDFVTGLQFSPDGSLISVTTRSQNLLFDSENGELVANLGVGGSAFANTLSFTGDGSKLLTSTESDLLLWDVAPTAAAAGTPIGMPGDRFGWINPNYALDGPVPAVHALAWHEDEIETYVVLSLLDRDTGAVIDQIGGYGVQLADGKFVIAQQAIGGEDPVNGPLAVWDPLGSGSITELESCAHPVSELDAGAEIDCPEPFFGYVWGATIVASADGSYFAAPAYSPLGSMKTVRVWDTATLEVRSEFQISREQLLEAAGTGWLAVHDDRTSSLLIYDPDTGEVIAEPEPDTEFDYFTMMTTPDGTTLFAKDISGKPSLWAFDTGTWETIATWRTHDAIHRGIAVSPDGSKLATTGGSLVKVWDITNLAEAGSVGEPPPLLDRIPAELTSDAVWLTEDRLLVFSAEGAKKLTVSLSIDDLVAAAQQRLTRSFTTGECATYQIVPCPTLNDIRNR